MESFFDGFMNAFTSFWINTITSILDFMTKAVLSVFSLQTDGSGLFTTLVEYIPFLKNGKNLMFAIAIVIASLLFIYNFTMSILTEKGDPLPTVFGRALLAFIAVGMSYTFTDMLLQTTGVFYTITWDLKVDFDTTDMFSKMGTGLAANTVIVATGVGAIIALIIVLAIGWNYIKLMLEIVERYVVTGILSLTSPVAAATLASSSSTRIFRGWIEMFISQCFLLIMSIFFIRGFNSAVAAYPMHGGTTSSGVLDFTDSIFKDMPAGNMITWLITMLAYLIVAQRIDRYMANSGMGVAQTGGNLLGEMAIAGNTIKGGMSAITSGGNGLSSFNLSGKGQSIASAQLGSAYSNLTGKSPVGAITSGMKSDYGAAFGLTSKNGATRVNSVPSDLVPTTAKGGLFSVTPSGEKSFVSAKGPDEASVLSPVNNCPTNYLDNAKNWNEDYQKALADGNQKPEDYANAMSLDRAAQDNNAFDMTKHQDMIDQTFGNNLGLENASMQIDPELPGKLDYAGTTVDGELVSGSLYADAMIDGNGQPTESILDSSGNVWSKTTDSQMPSYGEGALSGEKNQSFAAVTPELSSGYVDAVSSGIANGVDGMEEGRSYLQDHGISDIAITGMEERLAESMPSSGVLDPNAMSDLNNYVGYNNGQAPLSYFQNEHFPTISSSVNGSISSFDFGDRGTGVLYATTKTADGEYLYRLSDANQNVKPVGSQEIQDHRGSKYYMENIPVNDGESIKDTKRRLPQLRRIQPVRPIKSAFTVPQKPTIKRSIFGRK